MLTRCKNDLGQETSFEPADCHIVQQIVPDPWSDNGEHSAGDS